MVERIFPGCGPQKAESSLILSEDRDLHAKLDISDRGIPAVAALANSMLIGKNVLLLTSLPPALRGLHMPTTLIGTV